MKTKIEQIVILIVLLCSAAAAAVEREYLKIDSALVNEERIEYWLKNRDQLDEQATRSEIDAAVEHYIERYKSTLKRSRLVTHDRDANKVTAAQSKKEQRVSSQFRVDEHTITDVNVMAILIDFPDLTYNNNRLSPSDTPMFYSDYSLEHYREMLFSDSGFTGPRGENLLSSRQYYQDESGNSFNFSGQVYGWYTASHSAEHYGGNDAQNSDINAGALVLEAVNAAYASGEVNLADYDKDGDKVIDHLLVFHSSIGEEAGGGVLAQDAIWSHRFYVGNQPQAIANSGFKVDGYTIQPIDSAAGVVSHEFGHNLGLPDEYDTNSSDVGATVANWSVMAAGSWLGKIPGTEPTSFSPFARDFLQTTYGGKWINQRVLKATDLNDAGREISLVEAGDHRGANNAYNQIKLELPQQLKEFIRPFSGNYQYYSTHKNDKTTTLSFKALVPNESGVQLSLKAQWNIEENYDYVQIKANGIPLPDITQKFTKNGINALNGISNIITGVSADNQWQTLNFDLSAYSNRQVNFEITYVTDLDVGGFGIVVDDIAIGRSFFNDAETQVLSLDGFERITDSLMLEPQYYFIQLRSYNGLDQSLAAVNYTPGVLMWLADSNFEDNHVETHPGNGFLSVIDADQVMIGNGNSLIQVRDAAFSLYEQVASVNDNHTGPTSKFDDANDYTSPAQPQSGVKVTPWGIMMTVIEQETDSAAATINIARVIHPITANFDTIKDGLVVAFSQKSISNLAINSYQWNFGDPGAASNESNLAAPTHTFSQVGQYNVTLSVTDLAGESSTITQQIVVVKKLVVAADREANLLDATYRAQVSGGLAPYQYVWAFGDQSPTQIGLTVEHSFAQPGSYPITLTVTDSADQVKTLSFVHLVGEQASSVTIPKVEAEAGKSGGSVPLATLLASLLMLMSRNLKLSSKRLRLNS